MTPAIPPLCRATFVLFALLGLAAMFEVNQEVAAPAAPDACLSSLLLCCATLFGIVASVGTGSLRSPTGRVAAGLAGVAILVAAHHIVLHRAAVMGR